MIWALGSDGWFGWMGAAFLSALVWATFAALILCAGRMVLERRETRRDGRGVRHGTFVAARHAS